MQTKDEIMTQFELTDAILNIIQHKDEFTQSDLQGAVQAVIMQAINYGKGI